MKQQLEKRSLEKARMVVEDGGRKQRSDVAEAERGMEVFAATLLVISHLSAFGLGRVPSRHMMSDRDWLDSV
jgi:hypothetical protein